MRRSITLSWRTAGMSPQTWKTTQHFCTSCSLVLKALCIFFFFLYMAEIKIVINTKDVFACICVYSVVVGSLVVTTVKSCDQDVVRL